MLSAYSCPPSAQPKPEYLETITDLGSGSTAPRITGIPGELIPKIDARWNAAFSDGKVTVLTDGGYASHLSTRNRDRPVGAYATYQYRGADWPHYQDEVIAIKWDGSETVERIAHLRSKEVDYLTQAHATPSPDGKRVIWASAWEAKSGRPLGRSCPKCSRKKTDLVENSSIIEPLRSTTLSMNKFDIKCLVSGEDTGGSIAIFEEIIPPGSGPPRHTHRSQEEVFHVIEGTLKFEINGEIIEASPGSAAVVPPGAVHAFKNIGTSPAIIHFELLPAGKSEDFFSKLVTEGDQIADAEAFFAQYDMDLSGPPL